MDLKKIISDLRHQFNEINEVILALERLSAVQTPRRGRPPKSATLLTPNRVAAPQPVRKGIQAKKETVSPVPFLKERRHFRTLSYAAGADEPQAIALELDKEIVKTALASLEARAGGESE